MKRLTALTIGETADLLGMTPKAIRHDHGIGLVDALPRTAGGCRLCSGDLPPLLPLKSPTRG